MQDFIPTEYKVSQIKYYAAISNINRVPKFAGISEEFEFTNSVDRYYQIEISLCIQQATRAASKYKTLHYPPYFRTYRRLSINIRIDDEVEKRAMRLGLGARPGYHNVVVDRKAQ
ncbi:predicted protein [Sclerotinia sclerotiorum 1980 UF-70]|uniref:Uncharacterized protein n=1 Tax=Sclerotinia sclerotiorum (strain ATCC 18683 / 1980 / Ss-1) TaxID=665079 RepID=A7F5Y7_SCLS1|nr:predicted protein [Sclerotinia sclerotiorum 1980 UF-70]EDN98158.1 predicted protein [Sclerotinia sclerotiorum 1980 UF-70]